MTPIEKPSIQRGDVIKLRGYRPAVIVYGVSESSVLYSDKNDPRRNAAKMDETMFRERVVLQHRFGLQIYPDVGNR